MGRAAFLFWEEQMLTPEEIQAILTAPDLMINIGTDAEDVHYTWQGKR